MIRVVRGLTVGLIALLGLELVAFALDRALPPSKVLAQAGVYVLTPFTAKLLP